MYKVTTEYAALHGRATGRLNALGEHELANDLAIAFDAMVARIAELEAEVIRLRELVAAAEKETGAKSVRVEFGHRDGMMHLIVTARKSEEEIAVTIAEALNLLLGTANAMRIESQESIGVIDGQEARDE